MGVSGGRRALDSAVPAAARNQRLDASVYFIVGQVFFVTIAAYGKSRPFDDHRVCEAVLAVLRAETPAYGCAEHTYCLMPDHLHVLTVAYRDGASVTIWLERFKDKSTRVAWEAGWAGKPWQPRWYEHALRREDDLLTVAEYMLANPVRAGLVEAAEDWPWSGHVEPLPLEAWGRLAGGCVLAGTVKSHVRSIASCGRLP